MLTIKKKDLACWLAHEARFSLISQGDLQDIIETLFDLVVLAFQMGNEKVTIRGFGSFKLRKRNAFVGTHPKTSVRTGFPERYSLSFKPSAEVVRRLNSTKGE